MRCLSVLALIAGVCVLPTMAADELVEIKGRVLLDKKSEIPKREVITPDKDKEACNKDKDFRTENWVVDPKTRGIRDVVVYIVAEPTEAENKLIKEKGPRAEVKLAFDPKKLPEKLKAVPKDPVVFDQPCCRYIPHMAVARVGQPVLVKNSASIPHNVMWNSKENGEFNVILPSGGKKEIDPVKAERNPILIGCTIHGWMKAKLFVVDTPYYAVTNEEGEFTIRDIPPGKYRIVYWHFEGNFLGGNIGRFGSTMEIKGGAVPDVEYKYVKPEPEKK